MCGIVGYIGDKNAQDIILHGLEKLEYRGYDSAGLALINKDKLTYRKFKGRLENLVKNLEEDPLEGGLGIGHTRWATHGAPSDTNSHPHLNNDETLALVHNGIIENYMEIKKELIDKGYTFKSDTDTEAIAHLIDSYYKDDLLSAAFLAEERLEGSYALAIVSSKDRDKIVAIRNESPLILGLGDGDYFLASDIPAILKYTKKVIYLENKDVVEITKRGFQIYDKNKNKVTRSPKEILWDIESATKEGYDHFMLKEIYQQPKAIYDTYSKRLKGNDFVLENIRIDEKLIKEINRVYIVACGTAYYAGLVGRSILQGFLEVECISDIASEFRYSDPYIDDKTLLVIVSQSGETADTLGALKLGKERGARVLSITNVVGSSVARESHDVFYTWAGPEIAVASTKAYTTQLTAFYILGLYFGKLKGTLLDKCYGEILEELKTLPDKVQEVLDKSNDIALEIAEKIQDKKSLFYLGRGLDYCTALEGALKLKEISYIHTEAFPAGELKHGTIALIEEGTPVISIATQENLYEKMLSNIKEVKARGAYVVSLTRKKNKDLEEICDRVVYLEESFNIFMPVISVVFPQLLAYHTALLKGNDVDKPRNLAKSVTVE